MHDRKLNIIALVVGAIALVISVYAAIGVFHYCNEGKFNTKVEKGIEAYIKKQQAAAQAAAAPAPTGPVDVSIDDDAVRGDANAPVTIVEFSDFQCPFCGKFFSETFGQIKSKYIDTGKVKYVFRDFPLSFHQNARSASMAADCVKEAGGDKAYFEYHDTLYKNQATLDADSLKTFAKDMGYDIASCLDSEKFGAEVDADMADGQKYGVRGTPAFFINGTLLSGAQPFSAFETAIEAELAK
jgi:protein-disulfide isomerase